MLTLDEVVEIIESESKTTGGFDWVRMVPFLSSVQADVLLGWVSDNQGPCELEWSESNVVAQLRDNLQFAFNKNLRGCGITAHIMSEVVRNWLRVLEDPLWQTDFEGLQFLEEVASKWFPNIDFTLCLLLPEESKDREERELWKSTRVDIQ